MKKYLPVTCSIMSNDFWLQAAAHMASPVASHYVHRSDQSGTKRTKPNNFYYKQQP